MIATLAAVAALLNARGLPGLCVPKRHCPASRIALCADATSAGDADAGADADDTVGSDSGALYAALRQRTGALTARAQLLATERRILAGLANSDQMGAMWEHWYSEEGEAAKVAISRAAERDEAALLELMERYPDWAEPINRLATLRYLQGRPAEAVELCLKVLRMKPWHFGALSGIVMCYAQQGMEREAYAWAAKALPPLGSPERAAWLERQLSTMDERLAELGYLDGGGGGGGGGSGSE